MSDSRPSSAPGDSEAEAPVSLGERISQLEALFSHLERQQEQLNGVIVEQGKTLTRLLKRLDDLDQSMMGQEIDRIRNTQQRPPHYLP